MNVGRNELCPCGSGKKYKKCCINKEKTTEVTSKLEKKDKIRDKEIELELMYNFFHGFRELLLKNKTHIKEYKKVRKLHGEILDSMMKYYYAGKFKLEFTGDTNMQELIKKQNVKTIESNFDISTDLGAQAMANVVIYKNIPNINCITEEYINKNKFRKPEKIEFLKSMLNSEAGLFEIVKTEMELGQVQLRNVFTKKEYCITDIGLSGNHSNDNLYFYTRIITYNNISLGTGLNLIFDKKDPFIIKWIDENTKDYKQEHELRRFIELYNRYKKDNKGLVVKINNL